VSRRILIGGGSGLIGSHLTKLLSNKGYNVRHLGRRAKDTPVKTFEWDMDKQTIDKRAFEGVDVVINLAGANISERRWTEKFKKEMLTSRTVSTQLIVDNIKDKPGVHFIAGSAIGYYGFGDSSKSFKETDLPGSDFMAQLTVEWEKVASQLDNLTHIRTGIVVSEKGGAVEEMSKPIKLGVGAPLASGEQIISWIHIDDHCGILIHILENKLKGIFNLVAPQPVTNEEMTRAIARKLHRPLWLPNIPPFVLKIVLGEMADSVINGYKVSSEKIQSTGYQFKYPTFNEALNATRN